MSLSTGKKYGQGIRGGRVRLNERTRFNLFRIEFGNEAAIKLYTRRLAETEWTPSQKAMFRKFIQETQEGEEAK
jgi:hypothetical protein